MRSYASDFGLMSTALLASGMFRSDNIRMAASIDHTIWFHSPFRADEWLLYEMTSPCSSSGRGLSFGAVYTRGGTLVMSTAQEGLARTKFDGLLHQSQPQRSKL